MKNQTAKSLSTKLNNQTKGDVLTMNTTIENRSLLQENGYLFTVQDILAALSVAEGFKSRNSKNFARVLNAMSKGNVLLDILKDPSIADVPSNQFRYFKEFVSSHKLANRVYAPTRKGVLVPIAKINSMELREDKVYSTIDYTEVNVDSYKEISESFLSESFASASEVIEFTKDGQLIKQRVMLPMRHIFFADLYIELPEDEMDYTEEDHELVELRTKVMKEGFYYMNEHGDESHAFFLLRSASQARLLQAVFIDTNVMSPIDAYRVLGHDFLAYAKVDRDGNYVIDVDKMMTRPGLAGTNSIASKTVRFGNEVVTNIETGDQYLTGGTHTIALVEDRFVEINTGTYRAWDKERQEFRVFDASEHPITLTAADGALFCDEEMYHTLGAEFGQFNDAWQIRITPFVKGLMIFVPNLRSYYDAHVVALKSAVKGSFELLFKSNPNFVPQLRIAMFNKPMSKVKSYTDMPYQFIQASSLNVNDLWNVLKPHLDEIGNALHDPSLMKKYVGLDKVIDSDLLDAEVEHYLLDQSRVSTFTTFLDMFEWSYDDVQMKRYALDVLKEKIQEWKTGNIPVEGHYRYMIQDPYAVLEAGTKYEVRNDEGQLMITNRGDYHIQPNEAYIPSAHKDKSPLYVAAGRNPMIAKGEWQVLRNRGIEVYNQASRKGGFRNLLVMSVHDFATFAMGGADNDGDTALTVTEPAVVEALQRKVFPPLMDISFTDVNGEVEFLGDGVPYSKPMTGVYRLPVDMVVSQSNYRVTFTDRQKTTALYEEIHKLGIDYVIRTLKPNKIGLATNIASILADGVRGIGYDYMIKDASPQEKDNMLQRINKYENWINILRLVQGWEIDAAKHGGAYQEVMKETLDFMVNPPEELSYFNKGLGRRVWNKPNWLASRKGKDGHDVGSVLSRLMEMVQDFEDKELTNKIEVMYQDANSYSLLTKMNSSFNLDPNYFNMLLNQVKQIKAGYGGAVRQTYRGAEEYKNKIMSGNLEEGERELKMNEIDEMVSTHIGTIAEQARDRVAELMSQYPAKDIGYAAYYATYVDHKQDAGLSFPWTITREAFIQTLSYMENKPKQDQIVSNQVIDNNFTVAVCIPDDIQEKFTLDTVLEGLSTQSIFIQGVGDKYKLFINKTEVGFAYNSRNNISPLLGHDKFMLSVDACNLGKGTRTVNLEVGKLIKLGA